MRTPEAQIKAAILHPEAEIREVATRYFADSHNADVSVMPLVIQAVEKYGRERTCRLLCIADHLVQTPTTIQWLMAELRRSYDLNDLPQDNYRCIVAGAICKADPHLLAPVKDEILALPAFTRQFQHDLIPQAQRAKWDWPTGWKALQEWGESTMEAEGVGYWDAGSVDAIVRALGRFREQGGETVLNLLHRRYRGYPKRLMQWLEPQLVTLAGEMKLEAAIPLLIDRLHEGDDPVANAVGPALAKIGTEEIIHALAKDWPEGDEDFRCSAMDVFELLHCDLSVQMALKFLPEEEDIDMACGLGFALLHNFAEEGVEPVRKLVLREGDGKYGGDMGDLRRRLIAVATIMNQPFLEYPAWYKEAVDAKWGMRKLSPWRPTVPQDKP